MREHTDPTKRGAKNRTLQTQDEALMAQSLVAYHSIRPVGGEAEHLSGKYLRDYWYALRRQVWFIATITIFATLAIMVYELRQPDQYEAEARIEVGRENPVPELNTNHNSVTVSGSSDDVYFNTQLQILTSVGLLRRIVKTLDLEHNQAFFHPTVTVKQSTWQGLLKMVGLGGKESKQAPKSEVLLPTSVASATSRQDLGEAKRLEPYVAAMLTALKVEPIKETRTDIKETRLIDISFSHSDPQISAKVVNAIADASAYMNLERKSEASAMAADFLQKRIAELQSQIRRDEEQLLSYAKNNQIISLDASQNTVVDRLTGLNRELLEAENEHGQAEAAYRAALAPGAAEAMARDVAKQTNNGESKLAELRQRRVQLLVENTEEWPEVKEIDKQILELEKQIKDQRTSAAADMLKTLETRDRQTLAREHSLRGAFNEQRDLTITQNQAAINYKIIQQGIETNKSILQDLLQHAKENDITQAALSNNIHVIDYATTPEKPVGPKRLRNVGLAFILSLGLAIVCALMRENFDNSVRSIADVEKKLRVPALAIVPPADEVLRHRVLSTVRPLALIGNGKGHGHPELLLSRPSPAIAEVYRQLLATLFLSRNKCELRSLLVTSSLPSEGKTTTAINTAISLAESGANVLLIDGDMHRPCLHTIFEVDNERGLSTALSDGLAGSDLLALIKRPKMSSVSLLTSGPPLENPAKLFGHEKLRQLLATLESEFTHIVIDSPPIVAFADSIILSAEVEGVLMVVHGGKSPQEIVLRSMKLLNDVDAMILGVVLNNTKLQPLDTYYQSYCRQYYQSPEAKAAGPSAETT